MQVFKERNVTHELVEEVKCNQCGHVMQRDDFGYIEDHLSANKTWGYGSPLDGETHAFDLCHSCYSNLLESFKIPPKVSAGFYELEKAQ